MTRKAKKLTVSVLLEEEDYMKLKALAELESRSMASYLRAVINENYRSITPIEQEILKTK